MSDYDELLEHSLQVAEFGGRVSSPAKSKIAALGDSQLGSTRELPTAGSVPISPEPIMLAEMIVAEPICVDVTFGYPNLTEGKGLEGLFGGNGTPLQVGDGYVQITWGVKGAINQTVRVDGNTGWRFPFVASQLTVTYYPVDLESTGGKVIQVNQPRNLKIAAMIAPASGAPCLPLYKTIFFPNVPIGGPVGLAQIPLFAALFRVTANVRDGDEWGVIMTTRDLTALSFTRANGDAGQYPNWVGPAIWWQVPVGGTIVIINFAVLEAVIEEPQVKFQLAL